MRTMGAFIKAYESSIWEKNVPDNLGTFSVREFWQVIPYSYYDAGLTKLDHGPQYNATSSWMVKFDEVGPYLSSLGQHHHALVTVMAGVCFFYRRL